MNEDTTQRDNSYYVAMKAFLEKDNEFLILKDEFGDWDLPGGRIRTTEFETPLENILKRKMDEELGTGFTYTLDQPIVFFRHKRNEASLDGAEVSIFAVGFKAKFTGGEIELASHHTKSMWADMKTFKPEEYFTGGWLKGVQDYIEINNNK